MSGIQNKDMIPISIDELIEGISVPVDLYIRLGDDKFVLVQKKGQKTHKDQLGSYKDKEVKYLWAEKSEYSKISRQNITLAGIAVSKDNVNLDKKTDILGAAAKSVFTELEHMGISTDVFNSAKQVTEVTMALVENHSQLQKLLESFTRNEDALLAHSMAVSVVSVMIGKAMGWEKRITIEKLSLGGLLHDIGLKTLPPELLEKPMAQMSYEEIQLYQTHPFKGMQLLQSLGVVPDDIVSIVYEHQENRIGQGYPQRIREVKIHPLAKVVCLADQFCYLTMSNVNYPMPRNPREAIMFMEYTMGQPFNRDVFKALKSVVQGHTLQEATKPKKVG